MDIKFSRFTVELVSTKNPITFDWSPYCAHGSAFDSTFSHENAFTIQKKMYEKYRDFFPLHTQNPLKTSASSHYRLNTRLDTTGPIKCPHFHINYDILRTSRGAQRNVKAVFALARAVFIVWVIILVNVRCIAYPYYNSKQTTNVQWNLINLNLYDFSLRFQLNMFHYFFDILRFIQLNYNWLFIFFILLKLYPSFSLAKALYVISLHNWLYYIFNNYIILPQTLKLRGKWCSQFRWNYLTGKGSKIKQYKKIVQSVARYVRIDNNPIFVFVFVFIKKNYIRTFQKFSFSYYIMKNTPNKIKCLNF